MSPLSKANRDIRKRAVGEVDRNIAARRPFCRFGCVANAGIIAPCMARPCLARGISRATNVRAASMYQASDVEQSLRAIMGIRAQPD